MAKISESNSSTNNRPSAALEDAIPQDQPPKYKDNVDAQNASQEQAYDASSSSEYEQDEVKPYRPYPINDSPSNPFYEELANIDPASLTTVGQILRYHRMLRGLTINEVASMVKARASTISDIEKDKLNVETNFKFVSHFISLYSYIIEQDGDELIELYKKAISENVMIIHEDTDTKKYDSVMARNWILIVLIILVATAGYFVFSLIESNKSEDHPIEITQASVNEAETAQTITIEDPHNKQAGPDIVVVDENTARATAQQRALSKDAALQSQKEAQSEVVTTNSALALPQGHNANVSIVSGGNDGNKPSNNSVIAAPATQNAPLANQKAAVVESKEQAKEEPKTAAKADPKAEAKDEKAKAEKVELLAEKKLKSISKSVKIVNRDSLASLNNAEIHVLDAVALKVLDSSNKVIESGAYKKGDNIKVRGVPPFTVQVSNTKAVKISYGGGDVSVPANKQVKFELPMR